MRSFILISHTFSFTHFKGIKNIIKGASVAECKKQFEYHAVKTFADCYALCLIKQCLAHEFSESKQICKVMPNDGNGLELYGNEPWIFYGEIS